MAKKKYWVKEDNRGYGTSLKGYVNASYKAMVKLFGEPDPDNSDGYKVAYEWILTDKDGGEYTIYDYKNTTMYDSDLPSPEELQIVESVEWHIGGTDADKTKEFAEWLEKELEQVEEEFVQVTVGVKPITLRLPKECIDNPEKNEWLIQDHVRMAVADGGVKVEAILHQQKGGA